MNLNFCFWFEMEIINTRDNHHWMMMNMINSCICYTFFFLIIFHSLWISFPFVFHQFFSFLFSEFFFSFVWCIRIVISQRQKKIKTSVFFFIRFFPCVCVIFCFIYQSFIVTNVNWSLVKKKDNKLFHGKIFRFKICIPHQSWSINQSID